MANKYVSTTGSDAADGSVSTPWLTLQKGVDTVNAGDTLRVLPGTYAPARANHACTITTDGTSGSPITMCADSSRPLIDASNVTGSGDRVGIALHADYWRIEDFNIRGATQASSGVIGVGIEVYQGSNAILRRLNVYEIEGIGIMLGYGEISNDNLVENCDVHHTFDPLTATPGGNSTGISFSTVNGTGNIADGCRAWMCGDNGFAAWECEAPVWVRNCWAWANGQGGNSVGFKMGQNDSGPLHKVHRCIAFNHTEIGFDTNRASGPIEFLENTAFGNAYGFTLQGDKASAGVTPVVFYLRNNISAANTISNINGVSVAGSNATFNSWNLGLTVTAADFTTISETLAARARESDGSLPKVSLFRPVTGSDVLGAGTDVGLSFYGLAPDVGAVQRPRRLLMVA